MDIRKKITTAIAAVAVAVGGFTVAPTVLAQPDSPAGPQVAEAAYGWSGVCRTTYVYRTVSPTWKAQYKVEYRQWTDSLTGTTCRKYSTTFVKYVNG